MTNLAHSFSKPHFNFNPEDPKASEFADLLIADLGNFDLSAADAIINVGGDGTVIHSFHFFPDLPNFAIRPPSSNSTMFNGHYKIETADDLIKVYTAATEHCLHPLVADIELSDGSIVTRTAYQDFVIEAFNAQAALSYHAVDQGEELRVMGGGLIIASPIGSTAKNETCYGKVIAIDEPSIVVTLNGVSDTNERARLVDAGLMSRILGNGSVIQAKVSSKGNKRLTQINFDSWPIWPDGSQQDGDVIHIDASKRHIVGLTVKTDFDPEKSRRILIDPEYRTPNPYF
jgi:NAD kinase